MYSVKEERHDEAEIQELAARMVEARSKMTMPQSRPQMPQCQNVNILNFLTNPNKKNMRNETIASASTSNEGNIDEESMRGRFGWTTLGSAHIPYIFRSGDKYCAVRMVEVKLLNKYLNFLHQDIYNCTCIRSYYITDAEGRLLNEINVRHCDYQFGREQFTTRDLIVRLSDAEEFYNFLDACYNKLLSGNQNVADRCGFIRINQESVVPYTVYSNQKYVPLFYFEGETDNLKLKAEKLEGWDLSYLKFCCKVQGIRNELFAHDSCSVISLSDIKNYFPPGTLFEDYWPKKTLDSQLLINGNKAQTQMIQWTKTPIAPPMSSHPPPSPKPAIQAKVTNNHQLQNVQAMYSNYGISPGQPPYHVPQPRAASSPVRPTYAPSPGVGRQLRHAQPYYSNLTPAPPPPPLIRASQPAPSYTNAQTTASPASYMMLGDQGLVQSAAYRAQQMASQQPKYPPPLIPVRHLNGGLHRYDGPQYGQAMDAVDLAVNRQYQDSYTEYEGFPYNGYPYDYSYNYYPYDYSYDYSYNYYPYDYSYDYSYGYSYDYSYGNYSYDKSSYNANSYDDVDEFHLLVNGEYKATIYSPQAHQPPIINQQPAHQQSSRSQATEEHNNISNGCLPMNSLQRKLTPLPDPPTSGNHIPYQLQKALVQGKMIPCINMKPYVYTELLVTLPDLVSNFFNNMPVQSCHQVMSVLGIELYKGNNSQMRVLLENGKCQSLNEIVPLVQVRSVIDYMPQLKYMIGGILGATEMAKRQRAS